jgi:hypothetical protein
MGFRKKPHNFFVQNSQENPKIIMWKVSFAHNLLKNHTKLDNLKPCNFGEYIRKTRAKRRTQNEEEIETIDSAAYG